MFLVLFSVKLFGCLAFVLELGYMKWIMQSTLSSNISAAPFFFALNVYLFSHSRRSSLQGGDTLSVDLLLISAFPYVLYPPGGK